MRRRHQSRCPVARRRCRNRRQWAGVDSLASPVPAGVAFTILAPVWQRSWFIALVSTGVGILLYSGYRYRVSRLLELERVRTRIASDLHDAIGAALSRIAVLSEVARHEANAGNPVVESRLAVIAGAAREVLDGMNEIVWAINPRHDQLRDLAQRMRRFASDVLTARGITLSFRAPNDDRVLRVAVGVRRHVFLIFKEAINNIVRHSGATEAAVELGVEAVGCRIDPRSRTRLRSARSVSRWQRTANMRDRARTMEGELDVSSDAGIGTTVRLSVPVNATIRE